MQFYKTIADYYDYIFPLKQPQLNFLNKLCSIYDIKTMLDIGCATGAMAAFMSDFIDEVSAFDLDESMINIAGKTHSGIKVKYQVGDMLCLDDLYEDSFFDMITCFGNTLVHLKPSDMQFLLHQIKKHLNGIFVLQILNYDYIFNEKIRKLPVIDNDKITFKRYYDLKNPDKIGFKTILYIKQTDRRIENTITLYPIRKKELDTMLKNAGFDKIIYYRNYNEEGENGQHLPLIVVAK